LSIARLREEFDDQLRAATVEGNVQPIRDRWMGRKDGVVTRLVKEVATVPADQRRERGAQANDFKRYVEQRLAEATDMVREAQERALAARNRIDVTLPGRVPRLGHRHPLTVVRDRMEAIFTRMGFTIVEGPEVEDEWHSFDALNIPGDHPARDMQDTLYLAPAMPGEVWTLEGPRSDEDRRADVRTLLRTHTSSIQIRYMQSHQPPIRIVAPGRVYRRDDLDLTHTPMFSQMEGLLVGEGISLADLKGTLLAFARDMFSATSRLRFRPSFFPYTEPSAEVDISCWACDGAGCQMCKRTGWLEILGCGMVHPAVFEAIGYDAEKYTGFAWGIGMERVAMLRYQVDDIRLFFENDLRFLEQFPY
jgi:phenylalanyl-tRNA synthetase alpha chain